MRRGLILAALIVGCIVAGSAIAQRFVAMDENETWVYTSTSIAARTARLDTIVFAKVPSGASYRRGPAYGSLTFACSTGAAAADSQARATLKWMHGGTAGDDYTGILDSIMIRPPALSGWRQTTVFFRVVGDSAVVRTYSPMVAAKKGKLAYRLITNTD